MIVDDITMARSAWDALDNDLGIESDLDNKVFKDYLGMHTRG